MDQLDPRQIVVQMIILVLSIAVHEFGHAFVADKLGDRTPRLQGRVTLNPLVHADPLGTLLIPAMLMITGSKIGFGWGRPVIVNPLAFTRKLRMKTAHLLVAAAGPAMNILFGTLIAVILVVLLRTGVLGVKQFELIRAIHGAIHLNFILAFFNLIPAPPLDGGTVLAGLLPDRFRRAYEEYARYGIFVLMAFMLIPGLGVLYRYPAMRTYEAVLGVLGIY
ncbi:MAG: site-2 protease family protein [Deltaproteobacteria bacterium]|nr:site-2 protease family protein [Deltaproteobacteria bacterium]